MISFQTTTQEFQDFCIKKKSVITGESFRKKPMDSRYHVVILDILDEDDVAMPGWQMQITVRPITKDYCEESYSIFKTIGGKREYPIARLDVQPRDKPSHREPDGTIFTGAHLHEFNSVYDMKDSFEFDCEDCKNRIDWLKLFANRYNISIMEKEQEMTLLGGWECSA